MSKKLPRFAVALVLSSSAICHADSVDAWFKGELESQSVPGAAVAVVRDGQVLKMAGYGWANLELKAPVTCDTIFEIGSLTKQFTACLTMLYVQEGKFSLDDPIHKLLPGCPDSWRGITIRHLLSHTSGLKNYTGLPGFELSRKLNAAQFIMAAGSHPVSGKPGEAFAYCNTGYNLLGFALERLTGKSYWQLLRERVFDPAGMTASGDRDPRRIIPNRADGYELEGGTWVRRDPDLTDIFSAGAIASSIADLVKWHAALDSGRILPPRVLEQMWKPVRLNSGKISSYGLGWSAESHNGRLKIAHSGSTAGFSSSIQRYPQDKLTVIVLCNLGKQGLASALAQNLAQRFALTANSRPSS